MLKKLKKIILFEKCYDFKEIYVIITLDRTLFYDTEERSYINGVER
jgi:hypothetical protein